MYDPQLPGPDGTDPYRTRCGQTGTTAYIYAASAICNSLRELDRIAATLAAAIIDELPDDATFIWSIATDKYPDATITVDAPAIRRVVGMSASARDCELLGRIARGIADASYVVVSP